MLQIIPEEESKMFVARLYSRSKMITVGFWCITCGVFNLSVLFILFLTYNPLGLQFRDDYLIHRYFRCTFHPTQFIVQYLEFQVCNIMR